MNKRGFALVTSLGLLMFLAVAQLSLLTRGIWQAKAAARLQERSSAIQLAEAAINRAAHNMRTTDAADDIMAANLTTGSFEIDPPVHVSGQIWRVTVRGTSQAEQRRVQAHFRLVPESIFQFALFGDQSLSVSGSAITDSPAIIACRTRNTI